jgi:hypothetical protein
MFQEWVRLTCTVRYCQSIVAGCRALINGEASAGVSLHRMVQPPDAGNLLDQQSVAILFNGTSHDLYLKIIYVAKSGFINPEVTSVDVHLQTDRFRILVAWQIHNNLIRAVAHPNNTRTWN